MEMRNETTAAAAIDTRRIQRTSRWRSCRAARSAASRLSSSSVSSSSRRRRVVSRSTGSELDTATPRRSLDGLRPESSEESNEPRAQNPRRPGCTVTDPVTDICFAHTLRCNDDKCKCRSAWPGWHRRCRARMKVETLRWCVAPAVPTLAGAIRCGVVTTYAVTREAVLRRYVPRAPGGSLRQAPVAPARVGRGPRLRY